MAEEAIVDTEELREQDRFLPIANISRIMKKSLPDNAKIAKDAKETVQVHTRFTEPPADHAVYRSSAES